MFYQADMAPDFFFVTQMNAVHTKDQIFQPQLGHEMFLSGHPWAFIDYCRWMKVMLSRGMICQYGHPPAKMNESDLKRGHFKTNIVLQPWFFFRGYVSFRGVVKKLYVCCPIADFLGWGDATVLGWLIPHGQISNLLKHSFPWIYPPTQDSNSEKMIGFVTGFFPTENVVLKGEPKFSHKWFPVHSLRWSRTGTDMPHNRHRHDPHGRHGNLVDEVFSESGCWKDG